MALSKAIELSNNEIECLQSLVRQRTMLAQIVERAKMLLYKSQSESNKAIATTGDDLRPTMGNGYVYRDAEYKRLGTLSLLAGIDLLTGEAIPLVSESHKSSDFIALLKKLEEVSTEEAVNVGTKSNVDMTV